jgi:ABC-2 type transport system permease protein
VSAPAAGAALGRPIAGPSALGGDVGRFLALTRTLAITEFKLRFFGSVLGYLWQLMRPLLLFGVLYVVFTQFVRLGGGVEHYPVVLLTGILLYTFFAEATGMSVTSVVDRENLVRKIQFPRLAIPMSVVLTAAINLALNFVAVGLFMAISGVEVRGSWVQLPVLLLGLVAFAAGISMLLSALFVRFRDMKPIWEVGLQVMFYASPILYPVESIPSEKAQHLLMMNPLGAIIQQARHAVIDPSAPGAAAVTGSLWWMAVPVGLIAVLLVLGFWVFNREAPRIAEDL